MCHLAGYRQIYLFILTVRIIETLPDICASLQIDVSSHATKALHRITTVTVHPLGRFIVTVMLKLVSSIHPVIIQLPSLGPRFNSYGQNVRIDVHLTSSLWPRGAWVVEGLGGGQNGAQGVPSWAWEIWSVFRLVRVHAPLRKSFLIMLKNWYLELFWEFFALIIH